MLESMRRGQRWLTAIFIAVIGAVFVFFIGIGQPLQSGPSTGVVVELDDIKLMPADFERIREQQSEVFRQQLGDQFNSRVARNFLDSQALRILIDGAVMAHEAHALGLRVSKDEIRQVIRDGGAFRDEAGRFDQEAFEDQIEWAYGSQRNFLETMRRDLLRQKMAQLLYGQVEVSEGEARAAARHRLEEVRIAYVALDTKALPAGDEPMADEAVETWAGSHEDELRALYEERKDEFGGDEQVRLRHILFAEAPPDPAEGEQAAPEGDESARSRAEAALARLEAGEDFAAVAEELSDDEASREAGGDLGLLTREEVRAGLRDAAFGLEPGTTSGILESDAGLHLVRVEERRAAGFRPFEDVRLDLAREGATAEAARARADELADRLATAVRDGRTLEDAARQAELTLERSPLLRRRADGFITGLGGSPELLATAFALREDAPSSPETYEVGDKLVLIQLLERKSPEETTLGQEMLVEQERLARLRRDAMVSGWIETRKAELLDAGRLRIDDSIVTGS